jgi:hypothetical protein
MNKRVAFVLTTNILLDRAIFAKNLLENIGFEVRLIPCIRNRDKVLSNRLSMQYIYGLIIEENLEYAYVFEDDINALEPISIDEIIQYEKISEMFFYLGVCEHNNNTLKKTNFIINNHEVYCKNGKTHGLHAIALSQKGAKELLEFSKNSKDEFMDMIVGNFSEIYPANVVRYDLESYIERGHRGIIFQDRIKFPSTIHGQEIDHTI